MPTHFFERAIMRAAAGENYLGGSRKRSTAAWRSSARKRAPIRRNSSCRSLHCLATDRLEATEQEPVASPTELGRRDARSPPTDVSRESYRVRVARELTRRPSRST